MAYKSLDNILNDDSDTTVEIRPSLPEEATGDTPQQEAPEAPEPDAGTPPADDARKAGLEAGIAAERKKRQDAEALVEQLRREAEARNQEPPAPQPSIWEDEQGAFQHFGGQVVSQAVQQASYQNKLMTSEFYARKNIEGFTDSFSDLNEWLVGNPAVLQQAAADYDPWGYAHRAFQNQRTMQELGATDIKTLEAKIREQILAEQQAAQPAVRIPPSLSTQRSVSSRNGPAWSGPPSLGDLLK
jgi:hypothetical protein